MFCLLPTKCKQQQIAILIISFFLHVHGIRNEGNNMLLLPQQQQHHQQQQQPLHTTIENSNYESSSTTNNAFRPSSLIEFTLADATPQQQHFKVNHEVAKFPNNLPSNTFDGNSKIQMSLDGNENLTTQVNANDNRRYTTTYTNAEQQQYVYPNEQQDTFYATQQQQQQQESQQQAYEQQPYYQEQQQPYYQEQEKQQQQQTFAQQLTDRPIYIYKDPSTNENYHYTPTEPSNIGIIGSPATPANGHNIYNGNAFKQQQYYQPASTLHDSQEYLVHSSMLVGSHQPKPPAYLASDKDLYQKRPGLVYDESYISQPNTLAQKKSETLQTAESNKISYDSHDYPPPTYHEQQTSNFLPTPVPDRPPTSRPTAPPQVYATRPPLPHARPPSYATAPPPLPPKEDYRPRPPPTSLFGVSHQQQHKQQYLQSTQNALPNYANNLDNYLSHKQQTEYYQPERPSGYLQEQAQRYETLPPSYRPPPTSQQQQQQQYQPSGFPPYRQEPQQQQQQYQPTSFPPYRQEPQQQQQQQQSYPSYDRPPQYHPQQPPPLQSTRPSYNNYYDYQIGEIPPQQQQQQQPGAFNYPYPRPPQNAPYRPPYAQPTQQPSGLASLVQYAPQFTSLLLGGGVGGSNTNSPLGSLLGALAGAATTPQSSSSPSSSSVYNRRPINAQLIRALENIARNDDLQCVPKVVCQMIAGQTERGQLPSFITSPTITNFLAGFPASSPALIYGRAALLGLSGGDKSCHHTYVKCPKNEYEIIYYLNNHRGGFFKFFSEPDQDPVNHDSSQSGASSFFSILSALTGTQAEPVTTPRPRPKPQPTQAPSSDITGTIGNFFTQLLSDYMGGGATVEYQRRRRKRSAERRVRFAEENEDNLQDQDYDDEEDTDDTQQNLKFGDDESEPEIQGRVVHKTSLKGKRLKFFPETDNNDEQNETTKDKIGELIEKFNSFNRGRKLKFPAATKEREYIDVSKEFLREAKDLGVTENDEDGNPELNYGHQFNNYQEGTYEAIKDSNMIKFNNESEDLENYDSSIYPDNLKDLNTAESNHVGTKIKFPDREGKILNRPYYAASYSYNQLQQQTYEDNNKLYVSNDQRPQVPDYNESNQPIEDNLYDNRELSSNFETDNNYVASNQQRPDNYNQYQQPLGSSVYNTHVTSLNNIKNYVSNSATNNNIYQFPLRQPISSSKPNLNYFLPTPAPIEYDINDSYSLNPNNNFNSGSQNYNQHTNDDSQNSNRYTSSNSNFNSQNYNSYRPLRKPLISGSSSSSSSDSSYNSVSNQRYTSSSAQRYPNSSAQKYPSSTSSNSNNYNNRYHSSLYTTRRTTTTERPRNDNLYINNARGETEYYITPDGRKVYL